MYFKVQEIIEYCERENKSIGQMVIEDAAKDEEGQKEILKELKEMLDVMEGSATETLENPVKSKTGMIDGFAKKMQDYKNKGESLSGDFIINAMSMAFSTLETSANMGKIVASPTAGSSGILPAAFMSIKQRYKLSEEELLMGMAASIGIGQIIGYYANFSGAEGGCQAETGSASAMAAAGIVQMMGGSPEQSFHAASICLVNILGLVCDPIAGLVEYPCTFRNANGVVNALISSDMALAGVKSVVPFEEVCVALQEVGERMPPSLRETGIGGLAGTPTGQRISDEVFG
ncbi:MAG: L-serine ammonia-lyase, iron-sulfur-dependent, subunit alpha [Gallicola sp.]|nr:L-serine ammonia-lyase, iron-sulfur-dependent, subunit alpha [Gallicola sp.]